MHDGLSKLVLVVLRAELAGLIRFACPCGLEKMLCVNAPCMYSQCIVPLCEVRGLQSQEVFVMCVMCVAHGVASRPGSTGEARKRIYFSGS